MQKPLADDPNLPGHFSRQFPPIHSSDRRESIDHIRSLPENPPISCGNHWSSYFSHTSLYPYKPGTKTKSRLPASQIPNPCLICSLSLSKSKETKSDGKNIQLSIKDPFLLWPLLRYEKRQMNPLVGLITWRIISCIRRIHCYVNCFSGKSQHLKVYLHCSLAVYLKEGHHAVDFFRRQIWDAAAPERLHVKCVQALEASEESSLTHLARLEPELLSCCFTSHWYGTQGRLRKKEPNTLKNLHSMVTTFKKSTKASKTAQRHKFPGPVFWHLQKTKIYKQLSSKAFA